MSNLGGAGSEHDQNILYENLIELTNNSLFMVNHSSLHNLYLLANMFWDSQEELCIAFTSPH